MHRPCEEALVVEDERCGPGTTRSGNGGEGQMMGGAQDGGQMTGRQMTGHLAEEANAGETTAGRWVWTDDPPAGPGQDPHLDGRQSSHIQGWLQKPPA